jgi:hypothetical protein
MPLIVAERRCRKRKGKERKKQKVKMKKRWLYMMRMLNVKSDNLLCIWTIWKKRKVKTKAWINCVIKTGKERKQNNTGCKSFDEIELFNDVIVYKRNILILSCFKIVIFT